MGCVEKDRAMDLAGLARTPVGEIIRRGSTICK